MPVFTEPHRSGQPGELHEPEGGASEPGILCPAKHLGTRHRQAPEGRRQGDAGQPVQEHHVCHQVSCPLPRLIDSVCGKEASTVRLCIKMRFGSGP